VLLTDENGVEIQRTEALHQGLFVLQPPVKGVFRLVVLHEGYARATFPPFELTVGEERSFVLLASTARDSDWRPGQALDRLALERCRHDSSSDKRALVGMLQYETGGIASTGQIRFTAGDPFNPMRDGFSSMVSDAQGSTYAATDGSYVICDLPTLVHISIHAESGDWRSGYEIVYFGEGFIAAGGIGYTTEQRVWRLDLELWSEEEQRAMISGVVTDSAGNGVDGVSVEIVGTSFEVKTEQSGTFLIPHLTHGRLKVRARRVGYSPVDYELSLVPGEHRTIPSGALTLHDLPTRLRDITVFGSRNPKLTDFFRRRETIETGRFATREDWDPWISSVPSDILTRLRGFGETTSTCTEADPTPRYFLDGAFLGTGRTFAIDDIPVDWLDAIELYPTAVDAPPRYRRSLCAPVILMWTR
jgi:hypothetical protein